MRISRERYLDDTRRWHLALELVSRTSEMHSAIDRLPLEDREAIGDALVEALEKIGGIIAPSLRRED